MRQNRFYFTGDLTGPSVKISDPGIIGQIKNVLRSVPGDEFFLFDGQGLELKVRLEALSRGAADLTIIDKNLSAPKSEKICLYLALLKKENFELAVQKAVEVGVDKIIPLLTEHTVKLGLKLERLRLIIKEAVEQSGRTFMPEIIEPLDFASGVDLALAKQGLNIFCDLEGETIRSVSEQDQSVTINIFVGPEGGWSGPERELARSRDLIFYSLGQNVLRAETGAIVASWLAANKKL